MWDHLFWRFAGGSDSAISDQGVAVSENTTRWATRYLPHVAVATTLVAVLPVGIAWWLRKDGVVASPWVCIVIAIALALAASILGSAYWKRRRGPTDLMFSELLLWGWVSRLRVEHRLASATELLGLTQPRDGTMTPEQSGQLLRELVDALEAQDAYTRGHSRRVARHAGMIARKLGLPDEEVARVQAAAAVHDIGKLHVPREVLNKPGSLTDAEFEVTKHHAEEGAAMVACLDDPELAAIVRHHHERVDGRGYPAGLAGEDIPIGARIVAVADTFDALISTRPYRRAASHQRAIHVLHQEAGAHFDPDVVDAFLSRYSGKRMLALWAALAILLQRVFAWQRGMRRPSSPGQRTATASAIAVLAALLLATPTGLNAKQHPAPTASRTPTSFIAAKQPTAQPASAASAPSSTQAAAAAAAGTPSSTCEAYNSQLCAAVSVGGTSGARSGAGTSATGSPTGSGSALPFTGLDVALLALVAGTLVVLGIATRMLSRPRDRLE
jgi:putative nucleotidyltransferase with HDIG domain